jgi:hypothetical protein
MSFGAKKLRVQLPCGTDGSVIEEAVGTNVCDVFTCEPGTCQVFSCDFQTEGPVFCQIPSYGCFVGTCQMGTCRVGTPCNMGTCAHLTCPHGTCGQGTCRVRTIAPVGCEGESVLREPSLVVDADQLPVLRERLEAQLAEIDKAEQAVKERRENEE